MVTFAHIVFAPASSPSPLQLSQASFPTVVLTSSLPAALAILPGPSLQPSKTWIDPPFREPGRRAERGELGLEIMGLSLVD